MSKCYICAPKQTAVYYVGTRPAYVFLVMMSSTVHKPASMKAIAPKRTPQSQKTTHDITMYVYELDCVDKDLKHTLRL